MITMIIIEREIIAQAISGIIGNLIALYVNLFIFHASIKPLCKDIVKGSTLAIHTYLNVIVQ